MRNNKIKIFIIAGEVSGDILGSKIMHEMPNAEFSGIGGENMRLAGLNTMFPISDLAVMGVFEVLTRVRTLSSRIDQTAAAIIEAKPDLVLTIDAPGFAKRVIKKVHAAKKNSGKLPKFYHVVAPQVWAWGESRAKKFADIFDRLYTFFDFEVPYFTKYGLNTIAVGHPIADGLEPNKKIRTASKKLNISLIPGSRMSEVKRLLPIMKSAAEEICRQNPSVEYNFYIPVVETTRAYISNETENWCVKPGLIPAMDRYKLFEKTDIAIAASGTVSAELAIMHVPAIIVYKMNCITMFLARFLIKVKWASLVNILLNRTVYPELLGKYATPENIVSAVTVLSNVSARKKMVADLSMADSLWRRKKSKSAAALIADDIIKTIS